VDASQPSPASGCAGLSVAIVDEGMAETMTTNTLKDDGYAFVSGQQGLMAGPRLSGDKIARITAK